MGAEYGMVRYGVVLVRAGTRDSNSSSVRQA